ncbi:hypothetical protein K443DRAFT_602724 [Laccaria amethystina LaAM-08-1]|uniref:Uncharacterized protein n=1 Tax=Laccaria amethystina LaAM-08-1 TaxID=1095629 RepID=A0A0C9XS08_9AGAR|nr:hypothetical protein K443DRAFT_602724 [Laccaria amethystina LaAM-08-1]
MLNHSQGVVVNGGSLTNIQGDSHSYHVTKIETQVQNHGWPVLLNNIAVGAMHNSKERYDVSRCHEDTCKAVLKDISSWISDMTKDTLIL